MNHEGIQALGTMPVHDHSTLTLGGELAFTCACRASLATAPQVIPNGVFTKILFNAENYDIGNHFRADGVNSDFTVPEDGYYFINAQDYLQPTTALKYLNIDVDGGGIINKMANIVDLAIHDLGVTTIQRLTAGSVLTIEIMQNSGGALNLNEGADATYVEIYKIRGF